MSTGSVTAPAKPITASSAEELVPRHVVGLETALRLLHAALRSVVDAPATEIDLRPTADALARAIVATSLGFDGARDPLAAVRDATNAIAEARPGVERACELDPPLASLLEWLDNARGWLLVAEERHARVQPVWVPPIDLHGTVELPRVHHVARAPLSPFYVAAEPKPRALEAPNPPALPVAPAKSFDELDARLAALHAKTEARKAAHVAARVARARREAEREKKRPPPLETRQGFVEGRHEALSRSTFIRQKARDCVEEVAMIGMQRAPLLGDPWRLASAFEARLLSSIDALASLGSGLAVVEELILGSPAKDPSKAFAAAMIGGCFSGRDAIAMGERVARHLGPADEEVAKCVAGAWKLVPHPDLAPMLRTWATDPDPHMRAIAIEVLTYRGLARPDEILCAARDPEPVVKAAGIAAAGEHKLDELEELVTSGMEHADPRVQEATLLAMILGDTSYAADRVEKHIDGPLEEKALIALALGAEARHAEAIVARLRVGLTKPRIFAAGWAGSPLAFPLLLGGLRGTDTDIAIACAFALERITGASLPEKMDLPPEKLDAPGDIEEPDVGDGKSPSLARVVSDPRDMPSDGAPDRMILPTIRHDRWKAFLDREQHRFKKEARYRRGQPFTPAVAFTELDRFPLLPGERRLLHRELIVRTGQHVHFDPHDFVPRQEETLKVWGPHAYKASSVPGSWARARRVPVR